MPKRRLLVLGAVAGLMVLVAIASAAMLIPELRWRTQVILLKTRGDLADITWPQLIEMLKPGSGFWLQPVAENGNLYAAIKNPHSRPEDVDAGKVIFRARCSTCHDTHGSSGVPNLAAGTFKHGDSDWAIFRVITNGVPRTAMKAWDLSDLEVWQLVAYIRSIAQPTLASTDSAEHVIADHDPVTFERLVDARNEPRNWLTYSGTYSGWRYSDLAQIRRDNVNELRIKWVYQMDTDQPIAESTPLVVDGMMFLTEPPDKDLAVEVSTGRLLWKKQRALPDQLSLCCGTHNRGVAIEDHRIFRGTLDAHLIARDSRSGRLLWDVEVGDPTSGYSITTAPLAVKGMVIVGVSGGEFGIRGFLDAYDAETGERAWRTYTIPAPGEPGNDTWTGDSWKTGGGPTWMIGSYDPELNLVYWGVGNPSPNFNGDARKGDNLYTDSVIAVKADTGEMDWYFQFTPHDVYDWDANQVPILLDTLVAGENKKILVTENKNGFGYLLDRRNGKFLKAYEIATQTWSNGIDSQGRPKTIKGMSPSKTGVYIRPSAAGAANWWPSSYNPLTGLVYVPVLEKGGVFFKNFVEYEQGELFSGSTGQELVGEDHYTAIRAFEAGTGRRIWEFKNPPRQDWSAIGGTMTTAGELVFFGDKEFFYALDAETGEELWKINLGSPVHAAPVTYLTREGAQNIAVVAGRSLYTFGIE